MICLWLSDQRRKTRRLQGSQTGGRTTAGVRQPVGANIVKLMSTLHQVSSVEPIELCHTHPFLVIVHQNNSPISLPVSLETSYAKTISHGGKKLTIKRAEREENWIWHSWRLCFSGESWRYQWRRYSCLIPVRNISTGSPDGHLRWR